MNECKTVWITVTPDNQGVECPPFKMGIDVPQDHDTEEYIDDFLANALASPLQYSDWEFIN